MCQFFLQARILLDRILSLVEFHLVALDEVAQILIAVLHRHNLPLVLGQHEELPIAYFANLTIDLLSVLEDDRVRKVARSQPTIVAVLHCAKLAHENLLEHIFATKAVRLLAIQLVAWRIIFHLEFKDDLIWIESVRLAKDTDCHHCLHF